MLLLRLLVLSSFLCRFDLEVIISKHKLHLSVEVLSKLQVLVRFTRATSTSILGLFARVVFSKAIVVACTSELGFWLIDKDIHFNGARLDKLVDFSSGFGQGSLFLFLIDLAELKLLAQKLYLRFKFRLDLLSLSCQPTLLLVKLCLQVPYSLGLEGHDLALLLQLKFERCDLLISILLRSLWL